MWSTPAPGQLPLLHAVWSEVTALSAALVALDGAWQAPSTAAPHTMRARGDDGWLRAYV